MVYVLATKYWLKDLDMGEFFDRPLGLKVVFEIIGEGD